MRSTGCLLLILAAAILCSTAAAQPFSLDTLAHFDVQPLGSYSAVWGYTAPDGREYALIGVNGSTSGAPHPGGTAIIDITDPDSPRQAAFIPGPVSSWREMKTYRSFAYVVSEGGGGVQIIDLSGLPDTAWLVQSFNHTDAGRNTLRSHTISVHDGFLYLNGCANWPPGGTVIFDLQTDPANPQFAGEYGPEYFHDVYVRRDTLYASAIYAGGGLHIADATSKGSVQPINTIRYAGSGTHNAWLVPGKPFVVTTDEIGTTAKDLKIWEIAALPSVPAAPAATFTATPGQIVHNVTIRGRFAYVAWYSAGIRVVDLSNPASPADAAGYDTSPATSGYNGVWGVYPYFPSGRIVAGDMQNGLWVFSFSGLAPRVPASLLLPVDGGNVSGTGTARFRWRAPASPAEDPVTYRLAIRGPGVDRLVTLSDTSYGLTDYTGFQSGSTYAWHVTVLDEFTVTAGQDTFRFTFGSAVPPAPVLIVPENGATDVPVPVAFSWTAAEGASVYHLQVAADEACTVLLAEDSTLADTTYEHPDLPADSTLFWRVSGEGVGGKGVWSSVRSFHTASQVTRRSDVRAGWNLLSLPVLPSEPVASLLYPGAVSPAFRFIPSTGYRAEDTLKTGWGIWVKFPAADSLLVTGIPAELETVAVAAGWNLVGPSAWVTDADSVASEPPGIVVSPFFGYLMGYSEVPVLEPGRGYWVKISRPGQLLIRRTGAFARPRAGSP